MVPNARLARLAALLELPMFENLGVKVISLLLSIAIFSYFRGAGNVTRSIDLPVNVLLPAAGDGSAVLLTPLPESVRLTVRGLPSVVSSLRPESVGPVQIDLRDGHRPRIRFDQSMARLPGGVTFLGIAPAALDLRWDHIVTRLVSVRANLVGVAGPNVRLVEPVRVEPASIRVQGAASLVEPLTAIGTEPVDITAIGLGQHRRETRLEAARSGVSFDDAFVRLRIEVIPEVLERRFVQVGVTVVGAPRIELRPPAVDVLVRGDPAVVNGLRPSQIVPVAQLDPAAPPRGPTAVPIHLYALPPGVSASVLTPDQVIAVPLH